MMQFDLDAIKNFRFDQARDYFLQLSEREQLIVGGTTLGVVVIFVVILLTSALSATSSLRRSIKSDREFLAQVADYREEYESARKEVERLETIINQTPASFSLTSHLESIGKRYDVAPDSMNPKPVPPNELYSETQVGVRLQKVSLPQITDYLYRIQNSRGVIRINSISIKPNYTDPAVLNVEFSVSAFTSKK